MKQEKEKVFHITLLKEIDCNEQELPIRGPQLLGPLRSKNENIHIIVSIKKAKYKTAQANDDISTILYV